jgi:hypothetical protein
MQQIVEISMIRAGVMVFNATINTLDLKLHMALVPFIANVDAS